MTDIIDKYLSDDDKAAIKANRGRQLAEQYYSLSLIVPADDAERKQKEANLNLLHQQLSALES